MLSYCRLEVSGVFSRLMSSRGLAGRWKEKMFLWISGLVQGKGTPSSDDPRVAQDIMEADGMCET